jgi:hypothetical protein
MTVSAMLSCLGMRWSDHDDNDGKEEVVEVDNNNEIVRQAKGRVCVYLSSGFKEQCFNYAISIAKSFPPMTSLPYFGLVVLPLRTPGGIRREGFPTSPCILVGTPWQLLGGSSTT